MTTVVILDAKTGERVAGIEVDLSQPPTASLLLPVGEYKAEFRRRNASVQGTTTIFKVKRFPDQVTGNILSIDDLYGLTVRSMEYADVSKQA